MCLICWMVVCLITDYWTFIICCIYCRKTELHRRLQQMQHKGEQQGQLQAKANHQNHQMILLPWHKVLKLHQEHQWGLGLKMLENRVCKANRNHIQDLKMQSCNFLRNHVLRQTWLLVLIFCSILMIKARNYATWCWLWYWLWWLLLAWM